MHSYMCLCLHCLLWSISISIILCTPELGKIPIVSLWKTSPSSRWWCFTWRNNIPSLKLTYHLKNGFLEYYFPSIRGPKNIRQHFSGDWPISLASPTERPQTWIWSQPQGCWKRPRVLAWKEPNFCKGGLANRHAMGEMGKIKNLQSRCMWWFHWIWLQRTYGNIENLRSFEFEIR